MRHTTILVSVILVAALTVVDSSAQGVITTVAGADFVYPRQPLPGLNAPLGQILGVAVDEKGNVYIADAANHLVLKLSPDGLLTVVAGNGVAGSTGDGGPATSAAINGPVGLAVDAAGNLYIADFLAMRVRKVSGEIITTVAGNGNFGPPGDGGLATSASVGPYGIAVDADGSLYISDPAINCVRKVSAGIITTVAGKAPTPQTGFSGSFSGDGGPAANATLSFPFGLAVDSVGSLYIADAGNARIRKVSGGIITTVAGNGTPGFSGDGGPATSASFYATWVAVDGSGGLYIADRELRRIRKVSGGIITTVAGNGEQGPSGDGGPATSASLSRPSVTVDPAGIIYIADDNRLRRVGSDGIIRRIAGNGSYRFSGDGGAATSASFNAPAGLSIGPDGSLYVADTGNHRVRKVTRGIVTTVAGSEAPGFSGDDGPATSASLLSPLDVAVDSSGSLYIADTGNHRIRKISGGIISTVAGDGNAGSSRDAVDDVPASGARLSFPSGVTLDSAGTLYISDSGHSRVRKVSDGIIRAVAGKLESSGFTGDGGPATIANLSSPSGLVLDSAGTVYFADSSNNRIRTVRDGIITTVAGGSTSSEGFGGDGGLATSARLNLPKGIAMDSAGNIYIADFLNNRVRKVSNGIIATVAGNGTAAFSGDGGPATSASLNGPTDVAVDSAGNLYISDTGNHRVRMVVLGGQALSVDQAVVSLNVNVGSTFRQTAQVKLSNTGSAASFTASQQVASTWLSISPSSGTIGASGSQTLSVTANPVGLNAGTYNAIVNIALSGSVAASFTVRLTVRPISAVSSADYAASLTPGTIASIFASGVTDQVKSATELALPTNLLGVSVMIRDSAGRTFQAGLFFVSPNQVNFEVPESAATGTAALTLQNSLGTVASGPVQIVPVSPSLYTADASGTGAPAALVLYYDAAETFQRFTFAATCDSSNRCSPMPIDLGGGGTVFLQLYGTGIRNRSDITKVSCNIGDTVLAVDYAGSQNTYPGLDQVNIRLPLSLSGKGTVSMVLTVDGIATKPVQVAFQ